MLMRVALIFATLTCFVAPIHLSAQSSASLKALEGAAAKGNVAAMYALGSAAEADGDVEKALTHFRAAAEAGYAGAEFKLGECYEHGRGVPVDLTLAKDWYDKAAKQGLPQAIEKLNQLEANVEVPAIAANPDTPTPDTDASIAGATVEAPRPTSTSSAASGRSSLVAPATTQLSAPTPSDDVAPSASSSSLEIAALLIPMAVGLPIGFIVWRVVRGAVLDWYRSRQFFVAGRTAVEMMTKEVGLRLQVEWIPLVAGFAVFVGITVGGMKLFEILFGVPM